MTNNDVLRSIRYILNVSDVKLMEIIAMGDGNVSKDEITAYLRSDDDPAFEKCSDEVMAHCLNGLVIYKRGKDETRPAQPLEFPITNNVVLKKVRIAFELKDDDIVRLISKSGLAVTKTELSAFFRKKTHRNFRECGDQFLRNLLKGLTT